jgi:hypothetical protein
MEQGDSTGHFPVAAHFGRLQTQITEVEIGLM